MVQLFAVAGGGALGAILRFYLSGAVNAWYGPSFPLGTLAVNLAGSAAMGYLYVVFGERLHVAPEVRLALMVGVLGGFTTFSTFSIETLGLLQAGEEARALMNIAASVGLCLLGCWGGMILGRVGSP